jgi:hypothetical protein
MTSAVRICQVPAKKDMSTVIMKAVRALIGDLGPDLH